MKYEYRTTTAHNHTLGGASEVESPREPEGDGWELVCSSANESTRFFEWRRPVPDKKK